MAVPLLPNVLLFITTVAEVLSLFIAVRQDTNSLFVIEIFPPLEKIALFQDKCLPNKPPLLSPRKKLLVIEIGAVVFDVSIPRTTLPLSTAQRSIILF